ncbi:hypothetical protein Q4F19_09465 [Sphingomonas sp. BIUV-7]|uniref:GlsB/YeaQ/YmgE family stress response membrane protein n=1 Tax=Sphingomonas natans TaxID=3063330 RepID=A0ABT8Y8F5_9SPHN|nr:hypothetical protein [Sphingomonas sp. BIUV-7]MDO6414608.1 hypothetical protein [Sphingomonas sp. BIUV-7]
MGLIIAIAVGWIAGWFLTTVSRDDRSGLLMNSVAGISGAVFAGYFFGAFIGGPQVISEIVRSVSFSSPCSGRLRL